MITFATFLILIQVSLGTPFIAKPKASSCDINISDLDPEPIVVSSSSQFLYDEPGDTSISIPSGESITVSCPGRDLLIGSSQTDQTISATCQSGTKFTSNGETIDFKDLKCSKLPEETAKYTGQSCEEGGRVIEIGFDVGGGFAQEIIICFDDSHKNPTYSSYDLTRSIGTQETGVDRPSFAEDDFFNLDEKVDTLYSQKTQRETINSLLGLPADSTKYIQGNYYLARGHLTAKADFVYSPQQGATFHFVNAAPQWQSFNGGNWEKMEGDVRHYAEANELDLKVYTGTYGITTLSYNDKPEQQVALYLYVEDSGYKAIPVPELYWKVVYDSKSKRGVALLGINNPYQENVEQSIICDDISSSINWLTWDAKNTAKGYAYACDVNDFRKSVLFLPTFEVTGLLV